MKIISKKVLARHETFKQISIKFGSFSLIKTNLVQTVL